MAAYLVYMAPLILIAPDMLHKLENSLLFRPKKLKQNFIYNLDDNMHEINIKTANSNTINCIYLKNIHTSNMIIYAHGNGGALNSRLDIIKLLGKYSSVIAFDYSGYGKSTGKPCEKTVNKNIVYVWRYVTQVLKINPKYITLYGHSLGTSVVAYLGYNLCKNSSLLPHSIILENGFCDIKRLIKDLKYVKYLNVLVKSQFDTKKYINRISDNIKILVAHSYDDELINIYHRDILKKHNSNIIDYDLKGTHNNTIYDYSYISMINKMLYENMF